MKTVHIPLLIALGSASLAYGDACKDPKIKVVNDRSTAIEVRKIEYYDKCDNKWRTEDASNTKIAPDGGDETFDDTLEYVGNCVISKFRLYRAVANADGTWKSPSWGSELTPEEGDSVRCNSGVKYTIHAHN